LAQKFAPVLDNFVTNSMTFKKEITKNWIKKKKNILKSSQIFYTWFK
jgi:hypothetical protein